MKSQMLREQLSFVDDAIVKTVIHNRSDVSVEVCVVEVKVQPADVLQSLFCELQSETSLAKLRTTSLGTWSQRNDRV